MLACVLREQDIYSGTNVIKFVPLIILYSERKICSIAEISLK